MRHAFYAATVLSLLHATSGCGDSNLSPELCSTDDFWLDGDSGSELMHPGGDCIGCHEREDGPTFGIAGTVMAAGNDDDNCNGVGGVVVEVTGANGVTGQLETNEVGNFFGPLIGQSMPYSVELRYEGQVRIMNTPLTNTNCNSCHDSAGKNGAPGRIVVPGEPIADSP